MLAPARALPRARRGLLTSAVAGVALMAALPAAASARTDVAPAISCLDQTDVAGIDAMLTRAGSPLAGQGATFVAEGVAAGIDPRVLLAIAAHETSFETYAPARAIHNPFGLGPGMVFTSDAAAIARAARTLDAYYVQEGRIRIAAIGPKWAPIGAANDPTGLNRHWISGVSSHYAALGGDPGEPVLIGSQQGPCPAAGSAGSADTAGAARTDESSGPAAVTTWGGAALMILLVGYLARRRRRVVAAAAGDSPPSREGGAAPPDADVEAEAWSVPEGISVAWAQTAATAGPPLSIADASQEMIEDAEWTMGDAPATEAAAEPSVWPGGRSGAEDIAAEIEPEPEPEVAAAHEPPRTDEIDAEEAYWLWAEVAASDRDDAEPADWPIDSHHTEGPGPEAEHGPAVAAGPEAAPEPEAEPIEEGLLYDQAGAVADIVPALLDGLLPIERVCDRPEVTPRMLALLRIIADVPLSVSDQARRLDVPRTVVADLCARMEALGLAQREPLEDDRRRNRVALTPAGYELCADSAPALEPERVEAVLSRLTADERRALLQGLHALAGPPPAAVETPAG